MFKVPLDIILLEDKIVGHTSDPTEISEKRKQIPELEPYLAGWLPRTTSIMQCGKKSNHGLNYGETYKMFSLINEVTEKEAKVIVEFYHSIYPGIRGKYYKRIQTQLAKDRTLINCYGRKCRFLDRWGDELFKSAYSFIPQSTVGEIINRGLVSIYHSSSKWLNDWQILRQVHDSIDSQFPDRNPRLIAEAIREAAECINPELRAGGRDFRIATDCKIGYTLNDMVEIPLGNIDEMTKAIEKGIYGLKAP